MQYKLEFHEAISRWEDALPLGNGISGCLIWGDAAQLRFSLNRVDIWDRTTPAGTSSPEFTYANLVRLAKEKKLHEIRRIFDALYNEPAPTKLPAGKIFLRFPKQRNDKMTTCLQLSNAEALISFESGIEITSIVHASSNLGLIKINRSRQDFEIELSAPRYGKEQSGQAVVKHEEERTISKGTLLDLHYDVPERYHKQISDAVSLESFTQRIDAAFVYGITMAVLEEHESTSIFYAIGNSLEGKCWLEETQTKLLSALEKGYETMLSEHAVWWAKYWQKSQINIPNKTLEKAWYMSNYFLACNSRQGSFPMPLQGVWTADSDELPPWKGDYHNDLNTQMSYYHYLKANHFEEGRCFVDYLWDMRFAAEHFARTFYAAKGYCLPAVMTIDGKALGGWPMYSLSPTNQIWLCQFFVDYYRYTADHTFLEHRAYPYLENTARCMLMLLKEDAEGFLTFPISSSPEIHDDEIASFVTENSNYDQSLLLYLFLSLRDLARALKLDSTEWECYLQKLRPLAVNENRVLMLSPDESLQESHRHFSHAHAIHPLRLYFWDNSEHRCIIEATVRNLEQLGSKEWVGFSFTWMAELWAIMGEGEKAEEQLQIFTDAFCGPNGFHLNGDQSGMGYSNFTYHPFSLEANMCFADALQEMLLYMEKGVMKLFPALPKAWSEQSLSFDGFRGENGLEISATLKAGVLSRLEIKAPFAQQITLRGLYQPLNAAAAESTVIELSKGLNRLV